MTKVAVVILNWNGKELLRKFLLSVVENTTCPDCKIIVADNASTDASVSYIKTTYPAIEVIELSQNFGFAEGYNQALKQVEAEYYVLLNSDVEVAKGWLQPVLQYLDKHKDVAAAQPKILSYNNRSHFEYAGAAGGYIDKLGFPFCRGRIFDTLEEDLGQYDSSIDIFWASGACMIVRANEFAVNGGFDSNFFAHMEEIDFCWRLRARGKKVVCITESEVYHLGGGTLDEDSPQKVYLNFRNNMLMLYKNVETSKLAKTIRLRFAYNYIAACKFCLSGKREHSRAVLRAHKDFKNLRGNYSAVREENLLNTQLIDIPEIYKGNIVLDYYLRGKKRFSEFTFLHK